MLQTKGAQIGNAIMKMVFLSFAAQRLVASELTGISSSLALINLKPETTYSPAIQEARPGQMAGMHRSYSVPTLEK